MLINQVIHRLMHIIHRFIGVVSNINIITKLLILQDVQIFIQVL